MEQPEAPNSGPSSTRPPISNPPDPGPAPTHHGLDANLLDVGIESSVRVTGLACGIEREGSGFGVGDGDLVATIAHLVIGMSEPWVELTDGRKLAAEIVAFDPGNDLSLLRVPGASLAPLQLVRTVPDGTVGALLAWEDVATPDPTPFRIDRPITVRTEAVASTDRVERPSWLLAADVEAGDSGAALLVAVDDGVAVAGVVWSASRRGNVDVAYATRASELQNLIDSSDLEAPVTIPDC